MKQQRTSPTMNTLKTRLKPSRSNFNRKAWHSISIRSFPRRSLPRFENLKTKPACYIYIIYISIRSPVTLTCPQKRGTSNIQREEEREKETD